MDHSILSPSSAGVWVNCSGSIAMQGYYPQSEDSEASREGTAAHELCTHMIFSQGKYEYEGKVATNGVPFDEDMYDGAMIYATDILSVYNARPHTMINVEQKLEAKRVHELNWGTCDASIWDEKAQELFIWDFKYGYGIVDPFENWQLINYAAGLIEKFNIFDDQKVTVRMRICQPRAFAKETTREWKVKLSELRGYINRLHNAAGEALSPNAKCASGSHCHYCTAIHACPAALKSGLTLFEASSLPIPSEPTNEMLGMQLNIVNRAMEQLKYVQAGIEAQVKAKLQSHQVIPGWTLQEGKGRLTWDKPLEEIFALGDMMGVELRKPTAITPTQAKSAGLDAGLVTVYSAYPSTGVKLVKDTKINKAKEVFLT
jgi:hypothetical protein